MHQGFEGKFAHGAPGLAGSGRRPRHSAQGRQPRLGISYCRVVDRCCRCSSICRHVCEWCGGRHEGGGLSGRRGVGRVGRCTLGSGGGCDACRCVLRGVQVGYAGGGAAGLNLQKRMELRSSALAAATFVKQMETDRRTATPFAQRYVQREDFVAGWVAVYRIRAVTLLDAHNCQEQKQGMAHCGTCLCTVGTQTK